MTQSLCGPSQKKITGWQTRIRRSEKGTEKKETEEKEEEEEEEEEEGGDRLWYMQQINGQ